VTIGPERRHHGQPYLHTRCISSEYGSSSKDIGSRSRPQAQKS